MIASLYHKGSVAWEAGELEWDVSDIAFDCEDVRDRTVGRVQADVVARSAPRVLLAGEQIADDVLIVVGETEWSERDVDQALLRALPVGGHGDEQVLARHPERSEGPLATLCERHFLPM